MLVYAIVRAAEALVDGADGATLAGLADTVLTRRAWLRRQAARRRSVARR